MQIRFFFLLLLLEGQKPAKGVEVTATSKTDGCQNYLS